MNSPLLPLRNALLALGCCAVASMAPAQTTKPPKAQLWMDLPAGMGNMLGGIMGGRARARQVPHHGDARRRVRRTRRRLGPQHTDTGGPGISARQRRVGDSAARPGEHPARHLRALKRQRWRLRWPTG